MKLEMINNERLFHKHRHALLAARNLYKIYKAVSKLVDECDKYLPVDLHLCHPRNKIPKKNVQRNIFKFQITFFVFIAKRKSNLFKNKTFDSTFYKTFYEDLKKLYGSSWEHYLRFGHFEKRRTTAIIDLTYISNQISEQDNNLSLFEYLNLERFWLYDPAPYLIVPKKVEDRIPNSNYFSIIDFDRKKISKYFLQRNLIEFDSLTYRNNSKILATSKALLNSKLKINMD